VLSLHTNVHYSDQTASTLFSNIKHHLNITTTVLYVDQ